MGKSKPGENYLRFSRWMPKARWRGEFLNTIDDVCRVLYDLIFRKAGEPGLVVVAASTNSSNSTRPHLPASTQIARGLVWMRLSDQFENWKGSPKSRKPHLVTAEDPIEEYLVDLSVLLPNDKGWVEAHNCPDYTPRQLAACDRKNTDPKDGDVQNIDSSEEIVGGIRLGQLAK